jgi:hypothetical protein
MRDLGKERELLEKRNAAGWGATDGAQAASNMGAHRPRPPRNLSRSPRGATTADLARLTIGLRRSWVERMDLAQIRRPP